MGLEAECRARCGRTSGEVKALLESRELILRGTIKRTLPIAQIRQVVAAEGNLEFACGEEKYSLALGALESTRWARKLTTPAPTLARKLGVSPDTPAWLIGMPAEPALREALAGATTRRIAAAHLCVAIVSDPGALAGALKKFATLPEAMPIWIIHGKGPRALLGEAAVRQLMRAAGYMDNKVSAVSEALSATRYARTRPAR
jgi:hypothetical protein